MAAQLQEYYTPEEYLGMETKSDIRHEYFDGEIVAMAGASLNHNRIVGNAFVELHAALQGKPCEVFQTDLRLAAKKRRAFTYPDVFVICGKIEFDATRDDTVTNPILIIEVWSKSTQQRDASIKFEAYRQIPSLQEYVMIDQARVHVERYRRSNEIFWVLATFEELDAQVELASVGITIPVRVFYQSVEFRSSR